MIDPRDPASALFGYAWLVDFEHGVEGGFARVTGLAEAAAATEARRAEWPKRPVPVGNAGIVALERGIVGIGAGSFYDWHHSIQAHRSVTRRTVRLWQVTEAGLRAAQWQLVAADPERVEGMELAPDGEHVLVDLIAMSCTEVRAPPV